MDRAKVRGPYAKTAARRADIIRAARDSFVEHGHAAASLRDIAKRAGISHAAVLHHFRNKDELLTAVLAQRDDEEWEFAFTEARARAGAAARSEDGGEGGGEGKGDGDGAGDDPASPVRYLAKILLGHQKTPELMRLWAELSAAASRPDHPAHAYFFDRYERVRLHATQAMRERAAQGRLREGLDPDSAAALLQAVLHGLQSQWLLNKELDIIEPLNRFFDLILVPADEQRSTDGS
ncbi:TetR/AcrR family transcriptional regulator [Streptomyces sp. NPDC101062]|uniref:TetR/AcrR family transcriptional regulator n=1 Tax=unclassified Streptomyces TaxID=2593676 RepID=UPI003812E19D